jgi:alpha-L-fucosidase
MLMIPSAANTQQAGIRFGLSSSWRFWFGYADAASL